jgi:hypothetical protein
LGIAKTSKIQPEVCNPLFETPYTCFPSNMPYFYLLYREKQLEATAAILFLFFLNKINFPQEKQNTQFKITIFVPSNSLCRSQLHVFQIDLLHISLVSWVNNK